MGSCFELGLDNVAQEVHKALLRYWTMRGFGDEAQDLAQEGVGKGLEVVHRWEVAEAARFAQSVPRLVEVKMRAVPVEIDEVSGARSVDVGQADAALVELVGIVEQRRVVHCDLRAEATVAEVRPVAHLAVADPHQVG